jgi:hypothetical protein
MSLSGTSIEKGQGNGLSKYLPELGGARCSRPSLLWSHMYRMYLLIRDLCTNSYRLAQGSNTAQDVLCTGTPYTRDYQ